MLWIKAFHLIFMVTWFSGLFYLPRLFVYHAESHDEISQTRFKIMERKLFFGIMTPGALLTLFFGTLLLYLHWDFYKNYRWVHVKLALVLLLILYHLYLAQCLVAFKHDRNQHSGVFYRWLNEIPVFFLVAIVLLAILKPWGIV